MTLERRLNPAITRFLRFRNATLLLALAGATLCALPSIAGARQWMLDNLSSFTLHLFVVFLALGAIALVCRRGRAALFAAFIAALLAWRIYPYVEASTEPKPPIVTWLVANVHTENVRHDALLALIRERKPDVIGLVETDSRWLLALDQPLREYPHRVLHPREDNFGIALYSRLPLVNPQVREFGVVPTITASIKLSDREVDLVLVHVLPPVSQEYTRSRNEQLGRIGMLRPRPGQGLVIAGDLNVTPYSQIFRDSFSESHFNRAGGLAGSFPVGVPSAFRIPIDHVLAAGAVGVRHTVERDIKSDHLPFLIEIWEE